MRVTSLGHDGLRVESADGATALLINPWLNPAGAYAGTWLPWPDNSGVRDAALANVTAVITTSAQPHHLCGWTLGQLPATVPVLIPEMPSQALALAVERLAPGRPVTALKEWTAHPVGSLAITLVSDLETNPECAVVVQGDDRLVIDLNRARVKALPLRTMRQMAGDREVPDFVTLRPIAADGTAWGAEWPDDDKRQSALRRERLRGIEYAVQALRVLQAELVAPMAGSPALTDAAADPDFAADLVQTPAHVHQLLDKRMIRGVFPLDPGDSVDLVDPPEDWPDAPEPDDELPTERASDVAALTQARHADLDAVAMPAADASLPELFTDWFGRLAETPGVAPSLKLLVGFDVHGEHGGRWSVDLRTSDEASDVLVNLAADLDACDYTIRVPAAWLQAVLTGRISWDDLVGSLQLRIVRGPRHRKDQPLMLLRHAIPGPEDALANIRASLAAARTVRLPHDREVLEFERYCPHSGLDLLDTGELIEGGAFIRCIAHHYEFSLQSGACRNADCRPLRLGPET